MDNFKIIRKFELPQNIKKKNFDSFYFKVILHRHFNIIKSSVLENFENKDDKNCKHGDNKSDNYKSTNFESIRMKLRFKKKNCRKGMY